MRILAVASGGGHWVQLLRLRPAFEGHDVRYVSVLPELAKQVAPHPFYRVRDANRWSKFALLLLVLQIFWVVVRVRPHIAISTGAAPGYLALRLAKLFGARTIWLDSIANAEELSLSGKMAGKHVDLWLTQWPEVATPDGPEFKGAVF